MSLPRCVLSLRIFAITVKFVNYESISKKEFDVFNYFDITNS